VWDLVQKFIILLIERNHYVFWNIGGGLFLSQNYLSKIEGKFPHKKKAYAYSYKLLGQLNSLPENYQKKLYTHALITLTCLLGVLFNSVFFNAKKGEGI
jgi:hypothetical protein